MRELTYFIASSIDGYIADPDGDYSAFPVEGDHIAALLTEYTDTMPAHVQKLAGVTAGNQRFDTLVMGWKTYEPALAAGIDSPYPHLRQYVATRQSDRSVPDGMTLTSDPVRTVRELKAEPEGSGILLAGGAELAATLADEIDRVFLKLYPFLLGDGIRVFGAGVPVLARYFTRTQVRTFDSGVTFLEFARSGAS